ncbi:MAG: PorT family protein [Ignavibacteria bacterium]|nr:PorT family protein [Ignavibacteria bacterium]
MKNFFTLVVLSLLFTASGALPQDGKMNYGIFSGVSLNTNSFEYETGSSFLDTSYTNEIKPAFNIGLFLTYSFVRNFSLKVQGQYANKGGETNSNTYLLSNTTYINRTYTSKINYLQFSLLPQLNIPFSKTSDESKVYFNAGGYLSVKLSASENIENRTITQQLIIDKDITNDVSGSDGGLIFAAGIIYKGFLFDIRYDPGLSDITDNPVLKDAVSIKNRSLNFSLGWIGGF